MAGADRLTTWAEDSFYGQDIVVRESSDYQRVVVTSGAAGVRLFLSGNLQFQSRDEYRYHEVLMHPAMAAFSAHGGPKRVLVLGGGDGLAVREVLKYPTVEHITLVELDPRMTQLFTRNPVLRKLNGGALQSPKLKVVNTDAYTWLEANREIFDVIVIDFPDPTNFSLGKLDTTSFYQRADQALAAGGYLVVQTTSPLSARKSYWTVVATLEAVGLTTTPLHVHVPSFGEWGFVIASRRPWQPPQQLPGPAFPHGRRPAGAAAVPTRHGACGGRAQPLEQPGAGGHLRARVGQGALNAPLRRRTVLAGTAALLAAGRTPPGSPPASTSGSAPASARPPVQWVGASHTCGHRLRSAAALPPAAVQRRAGVLVLGGGVAGLAAARGFSQRGVQDVHLLELEDQPGGNSRGHQLAGMPCPLGAHYLPLPGAQAHEVSEWLHELGLLRHELGRTVADERHLCHSPQERLFFEGAWVEGLLPPAEPGSASARQMQAFAQAVAQVRRDGARTAKGAAPAFAQPAHRSAWGPLQAALDAQTFAQWLDQRGLSEPHLRWYLDYCCRDDYGATPAEVSAWAGLHYFASRHGFHAPGDQAKGDAEGDDREAVFTWPEGNAWLTQRLAAPLGERLHGGWKPGRRHWWCWRCRSSLPRASCRTRHQRCARPRPGCSTHPGWWPTCNWTRPCSSASARQRRGTTWSTAAAAWAMSTPCTRACGPWPALLC